MDLLLLFFYEWKDVGSPQAFLNNADFIFLIRETAFFF